MKSIDPKRHATKLHVQPPTSRPVSPFPSRPVSPAPAPEVAKPIPVSPFTTIQATASDVKPKHVEFTTPEPTIVKLYRPPTPTNVEPINPQPQPAPRRGSVGGLQSLTKSLVDHDSQIADLKDLLARQDVVIKTYEQTSKQLEQSSKRLADLATVHEKMIKDLQETLDDIING